MRVVFEPSSNKNRKKSHPHEVRPRSLELARVQHAHVRFVLDDTAVPTPGVALQVVYLKGKL
jgi:hypothetical protein